MKTYNSILMALIFIIGLSACQPSNNKHQELLNWLDSNEHTFSLDKGMSEDSAIIRVLASVSDFNQQATKSMKSETKKGDAVDFLHQAEDFNNYFSRQALGTRHIPIDTAQIYYNSYLGTRGVNDHTEAILLSFPQFMKAATQAFKLQGIDWSNPSVWPSKSFLIYPANYGNIGRGPSHSDKFQTSTILQFAQVTSTTNVWHVIPGEMYNFGDLKPPITIDNPLDGPHPFIN